MISFWLKNNMNIWSIKKMGGFPCGSVGKESARNVGDLGSIPGLQRFPGEGKWISTPVFLPREFHGQRSLMALWNHKESEMTE